MKRHLFAANWKMHLGPKAAQEYLATFLRRYRNRPERDVWFFPPAVSVEAASQTVSGHAGIAVGVQDIHWEPKGALTGAVSAALAAEAGAKAALVGHSERRHVFGETDADTGRKVRAALDHRLTPVLCVGEKWEERERGETERVVERQLAAGLANLPAGRESGQLGRLVVAYEPVWAIGTGKTATPRDAALVHRAIRAWLAARGAVTACILYGGSVNAANIADLLAEPEIEGVLVGGASLDVESWLTICAAG
ncbi:MAG: triose-phosphate isomerase [Gemmatimonadales bacterium]